MYSRPLLIALLALACAASPAAHGSEPPAAPQAGGSLMVGSGSTAQELVNQGRSYLGVPYRFGGTSPATGLDCSGLVQNVFRNALGLQLPRTAREMAGLGSHVERNQLRPGDLVFFNTRRRNFSHVGIYVGDDQFLHAPARGGRVRVESMATRYWTKRFNGARRLVFEDSLPSGLPDIR
ncbi:C40 family peptidase [Pseudothauera rhizosphaerae]|uniref:NlpC/P60 family protein n=1 Tax=Pseudothauera rhizosphaerae TaxID=2565932 RepID=A0A4S4ASB2_9RHOO|nr:C40 family peptidase [Pseudothauera rhizosphaerae]THF62705.1 NlpC/P60 family protein [Pseudothauera rhizosphaerae]